MFDYKLLAALAAVVEQGGFERGAQVLGLSQSAISQRIKLLEARVGQPVLVRAARPQPTDLGQRLLNHVQQVRLLEAQLGVALFARVRQRVLLTTTAMTTTTVEVTTANRESALDMLAVVTPAPSDECGAARVTALARRHGVGRIVLVTGRRTETSAAWLTQWSRLVPATAVVGHS